MERVESRWRATASEPAGRPWKTWGLRALTLAFMVGVAFLLTRIARRVDWALVLQTLAELDGGTLARALLLVACSYLVYAGFELLARRHSGHRLNAPLTGLVGAVAYAFNLSLGAWLGGIGFRYRLYSELGVAPATTARIYLSTLLSNWSGYVAVAGALLAFDMPLLPPGWELGRSGLRCLGGLLLAAAAAFLVLCARTPKRGLRVAGRAVELPSPLLAVLQMAAGAVNWMLMAGIVHTLLPSAGLHYATVLATLLMACVAGVVTHIPGGLGVLEAVFLTLLGDQLPEHQLLGALLAYRAVYFIGPLLLALIAYGSLELVLRRRRSPRPDPQ